MVTMFGGGNNNAPRGVTEPFSQKTLNEASNKMNMALKVIANQHVKRYAKAIENAAVLKAKGNWNATAAKRFQATETAAETAAEAATAVNPSAPASPAVQAAEAAAVKNVTGLIERIQRGNLNSKLNNLTGNKNYNNTRKININAAIAARKRNISIQALKEGGIYKSLVNGSSEESDSLCSVRCSRQSPGVRADP